MTSGMIEADWLDLTSQINNNINNKNNFGFICAGVITVQSYKAKAGRHNLSCPLHLQTYHHLLDY